jgi:hypothetical protein
VAREAAQQLLAVRRNPVRVQDRPEGGGEPGLPVDQRAVAVERQRVESVEFDARNLPVGHHGGMWRRLVLASVALAGCGGGSGDGDRRPTPDRDEDAPRFVTAEVRTPDARTALVQGHGLWSCETTGRIELRVGSEGVASLFMRGRLLASVAPSRSLVNRACFVERGKRLPPFRAEHASVGESHLRCAVPGVVLVDLRDGDLTVRKPGGAGFLLGAAVGEQHLEVAGHWSARCDLL